MHDTFLATLITIGTGGIPASSEMLRHRAAAELTLIEQAGEKSPTDETIALDDHLRTAGNSVGVPVSWQLPACRAPAPVAAAFTGATVEALANVARHAANAPARVRLTTTDGQIQGRGHRRRSRFRPGTGTRPSVRRPGGDRRPDAFGTRRRRNPLRHRRGHHRRTALAAMSTDVTGQVAARYARGATIAAVIIAACWHAGFDLPSTIDNWTVYRWPWLAASAWIGYLAVGATGATLLLSGTTRRRTAWSLAGAALALAAAVLAACPAGTMDSPANWATGSVGWLAVIVLWRRPLAELLTFLAVNALLMLVGMIAVGTLDRISFARYVMVILGSVTLQLGYSISCHGFDTAARWAAENSARRAEATARRTAIEVVALARAERFRTLRQSTAPILAELAAGTDPADPGLRHRCAVGAARLRRLIAETDDAPEPLLHEIRACADVAERRGVLVSLTAVGVLPVPPLAIRRALTEAPIEALSGARTYARVTVVGSGDEVVLSVLADAPDVAVHRHPEVVVNEYREEDRLWIETRWPAG